MGRKVQVLIGIAAIAFIGMALWPIFAAGEPWLPIALIAFLTGGAFLAYRAVKSPLRWSRYALIGIIPGFFIGGIALFALVRFGGGADGSDGWEDLIAVVAGILGAFIGSIVGAVCGGVFGHIKDHQDRRAG